MSDSWTPYSDTQVDHQTDTDHLLKLRDRLIVCTELLTSQGYSSAISEEISKELLQVRQQLTDFECGLQFAKDLAVANQLVASRSDHRSVSVLKYCLQQFAEYLTDVAEHGEEYPVALLTAFNELFALQKKSLLTENLFSIPDEYRIDVNDLQEPNQHNGLTASHISGNISSTNAVRDKYLSFSQTLLGVYRGESREQKLNDLAQSLATLADNHRNPKAAGFWLLCRSFALTVEIPKGELSPALFKMFKEIESVLLYALGDDKNPVLGMQQKVDRLLVNLLCYIPANALPESFAEGSPGKGTVEFAGIEEEFNRLHQSSAGQYSAWWLTSIHVLSERLRHCADILSEETLDTDESVSGLIAEVTLLKRLLILIGVHGARENLEEVENYLRADLTSESMQSGLTSVLLVEQQMLYQFNFLASPAESTNKHVSNNSLSGANDIVQMEANKTAVIASTSEQSVAAINADSQRPALQSPVLQGSAPQDFGTRCNLCIDVIQQSLDTALGSSGNLIPDSSVVNALNKLIDLVSSKGIDALTDLLTPLSKLLTEAEDSTLNQSETLLVQEAIIAATLGIDSLVGLKPMPVMVAEVTDRVQQVLQTTTQRLSGSSIRHSALSGFVVEAGELLPRLFELFQRLRGAPDGASRLYGDINRLLHSFKASANEADEQHLAELAHTLEATMVDLTQSDAAASQNFFDIAIESIECLDEDIERLRNSEPAVDRSDLIDRLKLESAVEVPKSAFADTSSLTTDSLTSDSITVADVVQSNHPVKTNVTAAGTDLQTGVVLLNDSVDKSGAIDWPDRLRQIEACYAAIDHSHKQLTDLQKRATLLLKTVADDQTHLESESSKALQSLSEQLQQIAENQNTAVRRLDHQLSAASLLDVASMGEKLLSTVESAADKRGLSVQFAFESGGVKLHSHTFEQISAAVSVLLDSLVTHAIPDNLQARDAEVHDARVRDSRVRGGKIGDDPIDHSGSVSVDRQVELATVSVRVQQNERAIIVDVTDDGCGVVVHGTAPRSGNPWLNVARPDWREVGGSAPVPPQAWSKQSDQVVNINGLLKVATRVGGTVALKSNDEGTCYRLCLPIADTAQTVLVFESHHCLYSIPVAMVESVGFTDSTDTTSLGRIMGLKPSAVAPPEEQCVCARTASGLLQFSVSKVIGNRTYKFKAAERVLPDVPGYLGVSVSESEQLVMLLDIDFWSSQQH